jgi:hypothetical protein
MRNYVALDMEFLFCSMDTRYRWKPHLVLAADVSPHILMASLQILPPPATLVSFHAAHGLTRNWWGQG